MKILAKLINLYRPGEMNTPATQQMRCFFHGYDENPSARYYEDTDSYYCFACGAYGDAVRFLAMLEEVSYEDAAGMIKEWYGIDLRPNSKKATDDIHAYEKAIVELVITRKPKFYNHIYKELDKAVKAGNVERLKFIFDGLLNKKRTVLAK